MGSRLGDTIHLLELLTTGAFGSVVVLAVGRAQNREIPLANDDSSRITS